MLKLLSLLPITLLISSTLPACAERILLHDGYERTDVPKQWLHVIEYPVLKVVKEKKSKLNVTTQLSQVKGDLFKLNAIHHPDDVMLRLSKKNEFVPQSINNKGRVPNLSLMDIHIKRERNGMISIYKTSSKGGKLIAEFKEPVEGARHRPEYTKIFNSGKSIAFRMDTALVVVRDLAKPSPVAFKNASNFSGIAGNYDSKILFTSRKESRGGADHLYIGRYMLSTGNFEPRFIDLGINEGSAFPFGNPYFARGINKVIICGRKNGQIRVYTGSTGKLEHTVNMASSNSRYGIRHTGFFNGAPIIVVYDKIIDLKKGTVIGSIPNLMPSSSLAESADGAFVYSTKDSGKGKNLMTIVKFDLSTMKEVDRVPLSQPPGVRAILEHSVRRLFFVSPGKVVALSGPMGVGFMDHSHVHR